MLKSPPLVATLSDSMRMSPCSWGDIFTWPLRGDRIIGLRQVVAQGFTRAAHRVTVFSRTAILAPGGWASDREPAKRFCGRSPCARDWPDDRKPLPTRNTTPSLLASDCQALDERGDC